LKQEYFQELENLENKIRTGEYKEGLMAPNFKNLTDVLDGIPFWANLMWFAGRPSSGKTAYMTALTLDLIEANPDSAIFFMSIDDNLDLLTTKMAAVRSGLSTSEIRRYNDLKKDKKDRFDEAMDFLKRSSERLIIVDASKGNTLDALENHVRWFNREYKDFKKVFILDNFHKLNMKMTGLAQKKDVISDTSSRLKDIADIDDMNIMASVELRKLQRESDRPTRQDMQGSNKLDYDATVEIMIHNDYQVNRNTQIVHSKEVNGTQIEMPWIEADIVKNKINGRLRRTVYKYNSHNMQFKEGNLKEWANLKKATKKRTESF